MKRFARLRITARATLNAALIAALIAVALMAALMKRPSPKTPDAAEPRHPVRVALAEAADAVSPLELPGRIEPIYDAVLAAEKPGRIEAITVERGDRVQAGEVLVRVDARSWEARARQAEIEATIARREFERWTGLRAAGAVSGSDFDAIQARWERAEAALTDARVAAAQCVVVAPRDGVIVDRFAELGEHANEGMPLLRLTDTCSVKIIADIPEREIGAADVGDPLVFSLEGGSSPALKAEIRFISPVADRATNTFRVEAVAVNDDGQLPAGGIVRVLWPRRTPAHWVSLPLAAVIPRRGEYIVFLAGPDGRAVRREVTVERITGDRALVSAGVAAGDLVVVEGQRALSDGASLIVVEDPYKIAESP